MNHNYRRKLFTMLAARVSLGVLLSFNQAWAQSDCQIIQPRPTGGAIITRPGYYCLGADLYVGGGFRLDIEGGHYHSDDILLLLLAANNIMLDLRQHSIISKAQVGGGIETPIQNGGGHSAQPEFKNYPILKNPEKFDLPSSYKTPEMPIPMNLTIRNGTVKLKVSNGIGIRISGLGGFAFYDSQPISVFSDYSDANRTREDENAGIAEGSRAIFAKFMSALPTMPAAYPKRNIFIENMRVRSKGVGIVVQGASTVIRNSVIETDAGTGIWIYGPNAIIENNTIIVHGTNKLLEADAPIRLQQADGAIIRNNRIIIKGDAHKRGISTFSTGAFTLENNTFYGITGKDTLAKAFLGNLQMNASQNHFEPIWKTWLDWSH